MNEDSYSALDRAVAGLRRRRRRRRRRDGVVGKPRAGAQAARRARPAPRRRGRRCRDALLDADRDVARAIAKHTAASGAATVALCAGTGHLLSRWLIAWVGDCRVYRVRAGARRAGRAADARRHLRPSRRDAAAGRIAGRSRRGWWATAPSPRPTWRASISRDGEMLVLCSDGLHKHVEPQEIDRQLRAGVAAGALLHAAGRARAPARQQRRRDRARGPSQTAQTGAREAMTPEQIDRVFGRGRLKMVTGEHVEVFREAVGPASGGATPSASSIRPTATSRTGPSANGGSSRA